MTGAERWVEWYFGKPDEANAQYLVALARIDCRRAYDAGARSFAEDLVKVSLTHHLPDQVYQLVQRARLTLGWPP